MAIKGVLWDMDGVLVDTGELHYRSWADTLARFKIPFSHEIFLKTFGMNNQGILKILLGHAPERELYDQISDQKEEAFRREIKGRVTPLPGVLDTLQYLRSRGIRQAIASSAPQANIDALVDELNLRDQFEAIVSGYGMDGKPAPDTFLASAWAIGIPPQNCLVIEDLVMGVKGAARARYALPGGDEHQPRGALTGGRSGGGQPGAAGCGFLASDLMLRCWQAGR